jgi:hypothetical protein
MIIFLMAVKAGIEPKINLGKRRAIPPESD